MKLEMTANILTILSSKYVPEAARVIYRLIDMFVYIDFGF